MVVVAMVVVGAAEVAAVAVAGMLMRQRMALASVTRVTLSVSSAITMGTMPIGALARRRWKRRHTMSRRWSMNPLEWWNRDSLSTCCRKRFRRRCF
jgi:hypothetical protein